MIDVETALRLMRSSVTSLSGEMVSLSNAFERVLAEGVFARRDQPPAAVSAMDGYAVRAADVTGLPVRLRIVAVAQAGGEASPAVGPGEAVRIFTGAAVPPDADTIVIQEDTEAGEGWVQIRAAPRPGRYIRAAGGDFRAGEPLLAVGSRLTARAIALCAAAGVVWLKVRRRPRIAILATGDELVSPGEGDGDRRLVNANSLLLAGEIARAGGVPVDLGLVGDGRQVISRALAEATGADAIVTIGGASVGDFDLVRVALADNDYQPVFDRVAMRPGKPLGFGHLRRAGSPTPVLVLPGNPVSAGVTARLFLVPLIESLLGLAESDRAGHLVPQPAELTVDLAANDFRQDYLRATVSLRPDRLPLVTPFFRQDSALLHLYASAGALIVRPPFAPATTAGDTVPILRLD
ncbi:MAG: gephyrin-like molybdotransferase Glp [Rhodospirillales bacterium]